MTDAPAPTLNREQSRKLDKEMKRKAPKRQHVQPRHTAQHCTVFERTINKHHIMPEAKQAHVYLPVLAAFDNIRTGKGIEYDLDTISIAMNTAMVLSRQANRQDYIDIADSAAQACIALKVRYRKTGKFIFSNLDMPEKDNLLAGIDLYEALLGQASQHMVERGIRRVGQFIARKTFLEEA